MFSESVRHDPARAASVPASAPTGFNGASMTRSTLALLLTGGAAGLAFTLVYLIEGVTRPGYDGFRQAISALSLGPGGWVQQVNFAVFGVFTLITALGWRQALAPGAGSIAYPVLRAIEGVALIVDGIFSQDPAPGYPVGAALVPPTPHGIIHVLFAFVCVIAIASGWFTLAVRFARERQWRGWAPVAALSGVLTIVFITLFGAFGPHFAYDGVLERMATGVSSIFGLAVLARLLIMRRAATSAA